MCLFVRMSVHVKIKIFFAFQIIYCWSSSSTVSDPVDLTHHGFWTHDWRSLQKTFWMQPEATFGKSCELVGGMHRNRCFSQSYDVERCFSQFTGLWQAFWGMEWLCLTSPWFRKQLSSMDFIIQFSVFQRVQGTELPWMLRFDLYISSDSSPSL